MTDKIKKSKKVAVISPYYKRKDVVERTLLSIYNQSYTNMSIIIWDDFSNDGTWEELVRLKNELKDDRLIIIKYDQNVGFTKGLNNAIEMTDADYIAIVGSGDICNPKRIEYQVAALENDKNAVFCATNSISINVKDGSKFVDDAFSKEIIKENDLIQKVPFTHGSVMFRKDAIVKVGLYDLVFKWCADWDLFLRLTKVGYGIYINKELYQRYAMLDGASFHPKKSMEQIECKYLVKLIYYSGNNHREKLINDAYQDMQKCVKPYEKYIIRDLWKRQIKLIFMNEFQHSNELGKLIEDKYGASFFRKFGIVVASLLRRFPISQSFMINFSRKISQALSSK